MGVEEQAPHFLDGLQAVMLSTAAAGELVVAAPRLEEALFTVQVVVVEVALAPLE